MILDIFGLVGITFTDVLDILLVALIIYLLFRWIRKSSAINVFFIILGKLVSPCKITDNGNTAV